MKVVVTSGGADLEAPSSPVFGRCLGYIFVDTDNMEFEAMPNPAISAYVRGGRPILPPSSPRLVIINCISSPLAWYSSPSLGRIWDSGWIAG